MKITLTITKVENNVELSPKQKKSVTFSEHGEHIIGRDHEGSSNDWDLIDNERRMSRQHATIFFNNGQFFIRDTSSSTGVWFCDANDSEQQVNGEHPLNEIHILFIGYYVISVSIEDTVEEPPVIEPMRDTGIKEEMPASSGPSAQIQNTENSKHIHHAAPEVSVAQSAGNSMGAFLAGLDLNLSNDEINNLREEDYLLLGKAFKESINGIIRLNRLRDDLKRSFDLDDTVFRSDNILKKSADYNLALKAILTTPENYTPVDQSIKEIHQNIDELLCVMKKLPEIPALKVKKMLAPEAIESISKRQKKKSMFKSKPDKWEIYCQEYNRLNVNDMIAISYKEELDRYEQKKYRQ